jgi:GNAT superfamily N-acetyltransferase
LPRLIANTPDTDRRLATSDARQALTFGLVSRNPADYATITLLARRSAAGPGLGEKGGPTMLRETLDLTGVWRFLVDPYVEGEKAGYSQPDPDVRLWREVAVPSAFDACAPGMTAYQGAGWFVRRFDAPAEWRGRRVAVRFEGVNYNAAVWLNGVELGRHTGGFLPFEFETGGALRLDAPNVLAVLADNTRRPDEVPGTLRGWRPYGGILREVTLVSSHPVHLAEVRCVAQLDGSASGTVTLDLEIASGAVAAGPTGATGAPNAAGDAVDGAAVVSAAQVHVETEVIAADGTRLRCKMEVVAGDGTRRPLAVSDAVALAPAAATALRLEGTLDAVEPWSPAHPTLYTVCVTLRACPTNVAQPPSAVNLHPHVAQPPSAVNLHPHVARPPSAVNLHPHVARPPSAVNLHPHVARPPSAVNLVISDSSVSSGSTAEGGCATSSVAGSTAEGGCATSSVAGSTAEGGCATRSDSTLANAGEELDVRKIRIGFRRIETHGTALLLNGEPIVLRGFNRHEDSPAAGQCTDLDQVRGDLERMKRLGCNFVRLCHYPHHPGELDLCDELGLLAMDEIPLYWWKGDAEGADVSARRMEAARRQLGEMIRRDAHHASVVFWSVSNETGEDRPEVQAGNAALVRLARELDPTRLAVHVSMHWTRHPAFSEDDVVCVNSYPTWWGRLMQANPDYDADTSRRFWVEELEKVHALYPEKPIFVTEFGYPSVEGFETGPLGGPQQARAIETEFAGMLAPYVCGTALWCFADHPWPEEDFLRYLTTAPFGVVTRERLAKPALSVVHRLFAPGQAAGRAPGHAPAIKASPQEPPSGGWRTVMVRPHLDDIPQRAFAEGFGARPMRMDDAGLWLDIQRDAEPFFKIGDKTFLHEYGDDLPGTTRRCFFITDPRGMAVGTFAAWYSHDFKGGDWGRIHWVAVRPSAQGHGLARAAMTFALERMREWHTRAWLLTSSARLAAERAWAHVASQMKHPVLERMREKG